MLWSPISSYQQYCYCSKCVLCFCDIVNIHLESFLKNRNLTSYHNSIEIWKNLSKLYSYGPNFQLFHYINFLKVIFAHPNRECKSTDRVLLLYFCLIHNCITISLFCIQRHIIYIILYILFTFNKQYITYHFI